MALKRIEKSFIELISIKDEAVETLEPLVLKEGKEPSVFVFKSPLDLEIRGEYYKNIIKLQRLLPTVEGGDEKLIQESLSKLPVDEQIDVMQNVAALQLNIVKLLLIGYKSNINGELIEKTDDLIKIIEENEVVTEFFTRLVAFNNTGIDKKKS